uniref:Polypeptide N-acetylgalactosaminyltransferase n=1 Tax=Biomphalaria glabrata TaxID=6526 RepID=A0A2C9JRE9_BIOGL
MARLFRRQRWVLILVVFMYFLSICVFLYYVEESEQIMKSLAVQTRDVGANVSLPRVTLCIENIPLEVTPTVMSNLKSTSKLRRRQTIRNVSISTTLSSEILHADNVERIDWNDYELIRRESLRQGPGEHGRGFTDKLNASQLEIMNALKERYKYNAYASDHISLERSLNDTRTEVCKKKLFLKKLPENSVSFVTIFNNERNSTLLRTIHGIVNRSPKKLLREIVVVDDFSTNEELKAPLEEYIAQHFTNVRIVRNKQREGLIRSRIIGANQTTGSFLVFLDAHVEVNVNFLPPLIEPMVLDYRTIVCPMVDNTLDETLEVRGLIYRERGAFDWTLIYHRFPVHQEDESEPHPVITMIGCAIAISRRWWEEIGMFDPGLEIWGGEQFEIAFKSWMCGGKVVDAPCSRVAHLFRSLPYLDTLVEGQRDQRNLLRVASVWMDEYKEYFFQRRPSLRTMDPGDLTQQFELRKRLNCKSFDWFMKEVAPDIPKYFPLVEPPLKAWGKIKSNHNQSLCMSTVPGAVYLVACAQKVSEYRNDWRLQIREHYDRCFTHHSKDFVLLWNCFLEEEKPTQSFLWDRSSGRIININSKLCLDYRLDTLQVFASPCNASSSTQSWTFAAFNATLVDLTWEQHKHLVK